MDEANEAYEERLAEQRQKRLAEEAVMRQDAERYRYLRKHHVREWKSDMPHDKGAPSLDLDFSAEGHDLDAAIDRAMKGANTGGKPPRETRSA